MTPLAVAWRREMLLTQRAANSIAGCVMNKRCKNSWKRVLWSKTTLLTSDTMVLQFVVSLRVLGFSPSLMINKPLSDYDNFTGQIKYWSDTLFNSRPKLVHVDWFPNTFPTVTNKTFDHNIGRRSFLIRETGPQKAILHPPHQEIVKSSNQATFQSLGPLLSKRKT